MSKHNNRKTMGLIGLVLAVIIIPGQIKPMSVRAVFAALFRFPVGRGPGSKKIKPSPTAALENLKKFGEKAGAEENATAADAFEVLDTDLDVGDKVILARNTTSAVNIGGTVYMLSNGVDSANNIICGSGDAAVDAAIRAAAGGGIPGYTLPNPLPTPGTLILLTATDQAAKLTEMAKIYGKDRSKTDKRAGLLALYNKQTERLDKLDKEAKKKLVAYTKLLDKKDIGSFNTERTAALLKLEPTSTKALDELSGGFKVPDFWRRLAFTAEGEVVWSMDWFSVGPKVGLTADLFKQVLEGNPDLSVSTGFGATAGVTMGLSKWFSLDLLLSLMRCSLVKEKTANTEQKEALKSYTDYAKSLVSSFDAVLDESNDKAKKWKEGVVSSLETDKALESKYNIGGWVWGAILRASFNLWINEFLAARVGVEWNIPFTSATGDDATGSKVTFRPGKQLSPYVGLVLAII